MQNLNNKLSKKIIYLIFISFFLSLLFSSFLTYKYDKYESDNFHHSMVKGDAYPIWQRAEKFKKDLDSGKNYLSSGSELHRSYLPLRTVAFFSMIFNYDLFSDQDPKKINLGKAKIFYLIIQSIIYFLILFNFIKKIQKIIDKESLFYCALFLCLCPSIILFHSSFHTESIFFSLQLLFLIYIINPSRKIIVNIIYGFLLGLMFLQKTIALFYVFLIIFFIIFNLRKKSFKPIFFLLLSYLCVLLFVGYGNFKRIGIFYFMPTQASNALYHYLAHPLISNGMNVNNTKATMIIKKDSEEWLQQNNINLESEKDRLSYYKYQKKYAINLIFKYPLVFVKYTTWKSIQTAMMNPLYVLHYFHWESERDKRFYLTKNYKKIWWPINITYSLFLYILILIGFIKSFNILDKKLNYLFITSSLYMFFMAAWVGHDRYMLPSLIYLSIYFGIGVMSFKKK